MPRVKIPLPEFQFINDLDVMAQGSAKLMQNVYKDNFGAIRKRPTLSKLINTASKGGNVQIPGGGTTNPTESSVVGVYSWVSPSNGKEFFVWVQLGKIYASDYPNNPGSYDIWEISNGGAAFASSLLYPISFASDGSKLVMASSTSMIVWDGNTANATYTMQSVDANAPTNIQCVDVYDTYLIATDNTGTWHHSGVGDVEEWTTGNGSYEMESVSDDPIFCKVAFRELYIFGKKSIEVWYNDGRSPFSRIEAQFINFGVVGPQYNSVVYINDMFVFLDSYMNFRVISGKDRSNQIISPHISKIFGTSNLTPTNHVAYGFYIRGKPFYAFALINTVSGLPDLTDITLVCDLTDFSWYKWTGKDASDVEREFDALVSNPGPTSTISSNYIFGCRKGNGDIMQLNPDANQDSTSTGLDNAKSVIEYAPIFHGTYKSKRCNRVEFRMLRGQADVGSSTASITVKIRDNGDNTDWASISGYTLALGPNNTEKGHEYILNLDRLGVYKTREWRIEHDENSTFAFAGFEEDMEVLLR